jgi:hypothetical protein
MKLILNILLIIILTSTNSFASFNYNNNLKTAHKLITELNFEEAEKILLNELQKDKDNSIIEYNLALIPFLKAVSNEQQTDIEEFLSKSNDALKTIKSDKSESPFKRYLYADLLIYRAIIHARQESYLAALLELKKAYQSIQTNKELYSHFLPNQKIDGIMNIVFGSVPDNYTWLLSIFNIEASVEKGEAQLYFLTEKSMQIEAMDYLFNESFFIYSYAKTIIGNKDYEQINKIIESKFIENRMKKNALLTMAVGSFYQNVKKNEKAIKGLESYVYNPKTYELHFLDYMLGESYLYKLNPKAKDYFQRYLKNFPGDSYKKSAWQKLAWTNLIENKGEAYFIYLENINHEKKTILDSDKQAQNEFKNQKIPNLLLLKSRLLFDGGYYTRASKLLENEGESLKGEDKIEYFYRLGRINDELKNYSKALKYYELTISFSEETERYFPANAALQSAYIYESQGNRTEAEKMYKLCFEIEYSEYRSSITQKAKAGLNRLEN